MSDGIAPASATTPVAVKPVAKAAPAPVAQVAAKAPATLADSGPGRFRVEFNDASGEYDAASPDEAWARFNDAHKTAYGPKVAGRKITRVG